MASQSLKTILRIQNKALQDLKDRAKKKGVGNRLLIGTHELIPLDSVTLCDPESENGVAYLTYSSLSALMRKRRNMNSSRLGRQGRFTGKSVRQHESTVMVEGLNERTEH
jgi:hypothetical protein